MALTALLHASKPTLRFFCTNIRPKPGIIIATKYTCAPAMQSFGGRIPLTIKRWTSGDAPHRSHVGLWAAERITAVLSLGMFPTMFYIHSPMLEMAYCTISVMHSHWGLEAIIGDYLRPIVVGPVIPKVAMVCVYVVTITTLTGLAFLIFNGDGIAKTIQLFWLDKCSV